jgi:MFS family permease
LWHLYLFYDILASIGRRTFNIGQAILVNRWLREKRGIAMGFITGQGTGPFLFSLFASYLIVAYSWQTAFFVIGAMMAVGTTSATESMLQSRMAEPINLDLECTTRARSVS